MPLLEIFKNSQTPNFKQVSLLAVDIDGTLTDGLLHDGGKEALGWTQTYHVRDGEALKRLHQTGTPVVPISRNKTRCARDRMESLGLPIKWVGVDDKMKALDEVLRHYDVAARCVAYIGDGSEDIEIFGAVGLGCAVADADRGLLRVANFVSLLPGGRGAVDDVIGRIIEAQKKWGKTTKHPSISHADIRPSSRDVLDVFVAGALIGALSGYVFGAAIPHSKKSLTILALVAFVTASWLSSQKRKQVKRDSNDCYEAPSRAKAPPLQLEYKNFEGNAGHSR